MDDLILDADSLFSIADIIDGYCAKQRETINVYYGQIMALESEWEDDETFGSIVEEISDLRGRVLEVLDEIYSTYPKYFRKKAQAILERPAYHSEGTTISGTSTPISTHGGIGGYRGGHGGYYGGATASRTASRADNSFLSGKERGGTESQQPVTPSKSLNGTMAKKDDAPKMLGSDSSGKMPSGVDRGTARDLAKTEQQWDATSYAGGKVFDSPDKTGRFLDFNQGKVDGYGNTCGIVSCVNIARMAGLTVEEFEALDIAIKNDLCNKYKKGLLGKSRQGGGTSPESRQEILKHLGIESNLEEATIDNIAKRVSEGRGVIISVRAGKLWGSDIKGLHAVTVTSVQVGYDGQVQGFFICDSGRHNVADACAYYRVDEVQEALTPNRAMNVTSNIIR